MCVQAVSGSIWENASEVELAQPSSKTQQKMINQFDKEKGVIQKDAGQFSVDLRRSSLIPYDDAKLAYLDHLIEDEKGKVQVSGSRKGLHGMLSDRKQDKEVRKLGEYARDGANRKLPDQEGIDQEIQTIHSLRHSVAKLQSIAWQMGDS